MKSKENLGGIYSACITAYDAQGRVDGEALHRVMAVSYTHLTLPTKARV